MVVDLSKWRDFLGIEDAADQFRLVRKELQQFSEAQLTQLSHMFESTGESIAPMAPAIALRGTKMMAKEGLRLANMTEQALRDLTFEHRVRTGYAGPKLVAEGDSWFQYPFLLKDTIDWLGDSYAIRNLAAGGDRLSHMVARDLVGQTVEKEQAKAFLLSCGGNDLLVPEVLVGLVDENQKLDEAAFAERAQGLREGITYLFGQARAANPSVVLCLHAYDYVLSRPGGRWLNTPLGEKGLDETAINAFSVTLMDRLATLYGEICVESGAHFIDCRRQVGSVDQWHDELHPTSAAYGRVAAQFQKALQL